MDITEYLTQFAINWRAISPENPPSREILIKEFAWIDKQRKAGIDPAQLAKIVAGPRKYRVHLPTTSYTILYYIVRIQRDRDELTSGQEEKVQTPEFAQALASHKFELIKRGWSVRIDAQTEDGRARGLGLAKGFERS